MRRVDSGEAFHAKKINALVLNPSTEETRIDLNPHAEIEKCKMLYCSGSQPGVNVRKLIMLLKFAVNCDCFFFLLGFFFVFVIFEN